jgi:beta-lactamase regulating signal transducer with metallopeptidase domain
VWLAARRLRLESEQACDDVVLKTGVDGSEYASELVDLARAFKADRQRFVPAAAIARPSSLERRVRAMLNVKLNRDPITRPASVAAALVLAVVTVLVAGFGVSAQSQFATFPDRFLISTGGRSAAYVCCWQTWSPRRSTS